MAGARPGLERAGSAGPGGALPHQGGMAQLGGLHGQGGNLSGLRSGPGGAAGPGGHPAASLAGPNGVGAAGGMAALSSQRGGMGMAQMAGGANHSQLLGGTNHSQLLGGANHNGPGPGGHVGLPHSSQLRGPGPGGQHAPAGISMLQPGGLAQSSALSGFPSLGAAADAGHGGPMAGLAGSKGPAGAGMAPASHGLVGAMPGSPAGMQGLMGPGGFGPLGGMPGAPARAGADDSPAFDAGDFPSLGGDSANGNGPNGALGNGDVGAPGRPGPKPGDSSMLYPSGAHFRALHQAASTMQHNAEFKIETEEFPALPGAPGGGGSSALARSQSAPASKPMAGLEAFQANGAAQVGEVPLAASAQLGHAGVGLDVSRLSGLGAFGNPAGDGGNPFPSQPQDSGFPALPGAPGGGGVPQVPLQLRLGGGGGSGSFEQLKAGGGAGAGGAVDGGVPGMGALKAHPAAHGVPAPPPRKAGATTSDRFGLMGLLQVISMTDTDLTTLALGTDLTTLGLNLNSPDSLYKTFCSPWSDNPSHPGLAFEVPECYAQPVPRLQPGHMANFPESTLFFVFYSMPQDEAQLLAADELCHRGWCFHRELKVWLCRVPQTEPQQKTERFERGSYLVFDINAWEVVRRDSFVLYYEAIERSPSLQRGPLGRTGPPS